MALRRLLMTGLSSRRRRLGVLAFLPVALVVGACGGSEQQDAE